MVCSCRSHSRSCSCCCSPCALQLFINVDEARRDSKRIGEANDRVDVCALRVDGGERRRVDSRTRALAAGGGRKRAIEQLLNV